VCGRIEKPLKKNAVTFFFVFCFFFFFFCGNNDVTILVTIFNCRKNTNKNNEKNPRR